MIERHKRWYGLLAGMLVIVAMTACGLSVGPGPAPTPPQISAAQEPLPTSAPTDQTATPAQANTPAAGSAAVTSTNTTTDTATAAPPPASATSTGSFAGAVRAVAQRVRPAVVQITNEQTQLDQFNQAFTVPAGVGSGVIYDNQGHILTNDHVVSGAERLLVTLPDGRTFQAKLVGTDPQTDLAVVQIVGNNLPIAALGDSSQLQVGDWAVAIGNALALPGGPTVTAGVVGALGRAVQEPGDQNTGAAGPMLFDVIQTSAPINPGNSGGPLVNLDGQVVGINTLVAGQAEPGVQAQGIGFAIAINTAKPIADQLVKTGRAIHPFLGISWQPLTPSVAAQLGVTAKEGAVVLQVQNGSPAAQAGLRRGDVIIKIDNQALQGDSALPQIIQSHKPGDKVSLTVLRGKQQSTVPVTLAEMPQ
jgi:serine protease Do